MGAKFGPAGNSESFQAMGYRKTIQVPEYITRMGLDAYEYQCGRGVRISGEAARAFGEKAREHQVILSLHSPYYISLSGIEEEKRLGSIEYILQSARAADAMGAQRVVVHSGSCAKLSRQQAMELAKDTLTRAYQRLDQEGLGHIRLCPETMGKVNQLGTLDEVLALCGVDERITPCIDFGHLYARSLGTQFAEGTAAADYAALLDTLQAGLGDERAKQFHAHFSRIAYTKGGEKCHLTFADTEYGPPHEPLLALLKERGLTPTIICESAGTQAEDAAELAKTYAAL